MASLGIVSIKDLLLHVPREYEDRSSTVPLKDWEQGAVNTVVEVIAHDYFGFGRKETLKIHITDGTTQAVLVCFNRNFLKNVLLPGNKYHLYGHFTYRYGELQSTLFETEPYPAPPAKFGRILPVYPLSMKLNQGIMRRAVQEALEGYGRHIEDELPPPLRDHYGFPEKHRALEHLHFPETFDDLLLARRALAYEELFYFQILVARRARLRNLSTRKPGLLPEGLQKRCLSSLPFRLTPDQKKTLTEIQQDLNSAKPMARLLQGDVGSGKTLVAFLSALPVIEAGYQAAFLAPTELLARQHAENAARLLEGLGVRLAFLSGNVGRKARTPLLEALRTGAIDLIIGTHALFTEEVAFRDLRYVIIDEQHKFGVEQRGILVEKGKSPDLLLMTATPIPRTLTLTFFGDLDVSSLRTMPPGRKPVITHLARQGNEEKVYTAVRRELERGHQAYFVYPRISHTGKSSLKDAESMARYLQTRVFPDFRLAMLHSRIPEEEKIRIMDEFARGDLQILVSTSVVEVGVDVANATCMVVEHAERFGLSGLHQLRGRVGRSTLQSYAFLIYSEELSEEGRQRLMVMKKTTDGFKISEEDLKIRGPGEMTGTRQAGAMSLSFADISEDLRLLEQARKDAFRLIEADPGLLQPPNSRLRRVLETCPPFPEDLLAGG
jgi:ATP-dependent DNA helicase RecG